MKLRIHRALVVVLIAGWLAPAVTFAAIDLMPKEIIVGNDGATAQIINNGNRPEYVSISLAHLLNPGVPLRDEKLEQVGDMESPMLFVSPSKLTLAPGQAKTIMLKPMRPVDTETVYRLNVNPVIAALGEQKTHAVGAVIVNLGFSGLVRQLPVSQHKALKVTCDERGVRLISTGNVRYAVNGAKVNGRVIEPFNVYPGVPLPAPGNAVEIPGQPVCQFNDSVSNQLSH
ncbi:hypothetical protein K7N18_30090 [Burkholderia arboris]|uniref:hypothetical protein n=1 Tax=Burkholderia arboris TaxID=488730 RepID=UPI001CA4693A|nr:hypothetical protein [Burkholderia arboris]MBY8609079.1 hypothetical protein [Burkholderia arboris]